MPHHFNSVLDFPWIEYDPAIEKAFCSICKRAKDGSLKLQKEHGAKQVMWSSAWVEEGWSTWGRSRELMGKHQDSSSHRQAVSYVSRICQEDSIGNQLTDQFSEQQRENRLALRTIIQEVQFLCRQGLAFRGRSDEEGNFRQLVTLLGQFSTSLEKYLYRKGFKWLSCYTQNTLIGSLGNGVLRTLVNEVVCNVFFGVIMDETTDCSIVEQVAIVLRTVSWDLEVSEHFVGLYNTKDATADTLTGLLVNTLEDISKRSFNLKNCRAQSYDGGANMKGHLTGVQTRVRGIQPKATFPTAVGTCLTWFTRMRLRKRAYLQQQ